jgi:hypothetical protein
MQIDARYKLPKARYVGSISTQWVRDVSADPKIEDITVNSQTCSSKGVADVHRKHDTKATTLPAPEYKVWAQWLECGSLATKDVTGVSIGGIGEALAYLTADPSNLVTCFIPLQMIP